MRSHSLSTLKRRETLMEATVTVCNAFSFSSPTVFKSPFSPGHARNRAFSKRSTFDSFQKPLFSSVFREFLLGTICENASIHLLVACVFKRKRIGVVGALLECARTTQDFMLLSVMAPRDMYLCQQLFSWTFKDWDDPQVELIN